MSRPRYSVQVNDSGSTLIGSPRTGTPMDRGFARLVLVRLGYPVTVSDCVDTGPAPAPGNADPTPLNITSVTVYCPGWLYTCVGDRPEPVVPSPNSHRYVITGCALTVLSAEKRTGRPAGGFAGPKVNPGVIPLWPVVTMPPLPVEVPSLAMMVRPTE